MTLIKCLSALRVTLLAGLLLIAVAPALALADEGAKPTYTDDDGTGGSSGKDVDRDTYLKDDDGTGGGSGKTVGIDGTGGSSADTSNGDGTGGSSGFDN